MTSGHSRIYGQKIFKIGQPEVSLFGKKLSKFELMLSFFQKLTPTKTLSFGATVGPRQFPLAHLTPISKPRVEKVLAADNLTSREWWPENQFPPK
jgi:hypothetical protein